MHEAIRHFICVKLYYWDQTDFVTMKMNNYYSYVTVGAPMSKNVERHSSQTLKQQSVLQKLRLVFGLNVSTDFLIRFLDV